MLIEHNEGRGQLSVRLVLVLLFLTIGWTHPIVAQEGSIRFRITTDTVVAGVSCAPTGRAYAVVYDDGKLDECPMGVDTIIAGHPIARGTWIRLHPSQKLRSLWLNEHQEVQGIPCRGTGYKGWAVTFHDNGTLSLCYLSRSAVIDGVPCAGASFLTEMTGNSGVSLDDQQRLTRCRLSRDYVRNGVRYKKGRPFTVP
ncbi:MAG: hypothetical protein IT353_24300 [Gemmatimonadaceae bacterium]|nr:hypothetical protein [Gemmatimonadaceae bacterium]